MPVSLNTLQQQHDCLLDLPEWDDWGDDRPTRGKICDAAIALDTSPVTIYNRLKSGLVVNGVLYAPLKGKSDPRYIK